MAGATVRDGVIGTPDRPTVPFAPAAGVSGTTASATLVVAAGLAEIAAGSIAMGLGVCPAARGEAEYREREPRREEAGIPDVPDVEVAEMPGSSAATAPPGPRAGRCRNR